MSTSAEVEARLARLTAVGDDLSDDLRDVTSDDAPYPDLIYEWEAAKAWDGTPPTKALSRIQRRSGTRP